MTLQNKLTFLAILTFGILFFNGCGDSKKRQPIVKKKATINIGSDTTIDSIAEVFAFDYVPVEGYALIGGLNHTGSRQCPLRIREYLEKYIKSQLSNEKNISKYMTSDTTAVVAVEGMMPASLHTFSIHSR